MFRIWRTLGLDDGKDGLSFNKTVTAVMTATVVYAVVHGIEVGVNLLILALGVLFGGFGLKGLSLFTTLYRRRDTVALSGTMADALQAIPAVQQRRDDTHGIDPA